MGNDIGNVSGHSAYVERKMRHLIALVNKQPSVKGCKGGELKRDVSHKRGVEIERGEHCLKITLYCGDGTQWTYANLNNGGNIDVMEKEVTEAVKTRFRLIEKGEVSKMARRLRFNQDGAMIIEDEGLAEVYCALHQASIVDESGMRVVEKMRVALEPLGLPIKKVEQVQSNKRILRPLVPGRKSTGGRYELMPAVMMVSGYVIDDSVGRVPNPDPAEGSRVVPAGEKEDGGDMRIPVAEAKEAFEALWEKTERDAEELKTKADKLQGESVSIHEKAVALHEQASAIEAESVEKWQQAEAVLGEVAAKKAKSAIVWKKIEALSGGKTEETTG